MQCSALPVRLGRSNNMSQVDKGLSTFCTLFGFEIEYLRNMVPEIWHFISNQKGSSYLSATAYQACTQLIYYCQTESQDSDWFPRTRKATNDLS